jgi:hypothetical protein
MRRIFWGFCRNWFLMDPLHYLSSCSEFGFEFAEIFVIEKLLPDSASRRLSDTASWGVSDSPTRRLPDSASQEVAISLTWRVGELSTPRLGKSGSRHCESGSRYSNFLKYIIYFPSFKRLSQSFKRSIWQK